MKLVSTSQLDEILYCMRGIFQKIPEFCNGWCYSLGKIILEYFDLNQFQVPTHFSKSIVK